MERSKLEPIPYAQSPERPSQLGRAAMSVTLVAVAANVVVFITAQAGIIPISGANELFVAAAGIGCAGALLGAGACVRSRDRRVGVASALIGTGNAVVASLLMYG